MKHMKKALSVLLTLVAVFALSTSAFAADNYTITINNTNSGHTYEAYQIFTGRLDDNVLSDIEWGSGVNRIGLIAALKEINAFADLADTATAADVAKILSGAANDGDLAKAFASVIGAHLSKTVAGTSQENKDGEGKTINYTISNLKAGYYLVKDQDDTQDGDNDTYTRYILNVVKDVTVHHKGTVPTVDKEITDEGEAADFDIGDNVPFTLTATLPNNVTDYETYKIVFHDTLSAGLTLNRDTIAVTINGKTVTNDFNINANGTSLTISCDDVLTLGATNGSKIVVTYTAKLNENAVIGQPGNSNKVKLEYSNDPNHDGDGTGETPE
ncbi:MAG: isopeptide-forming domain-containing fimbrial protein, partial [Oscillospiraceae bacterium]|nr:isopeptide-forming domain-containing fimbrial protein [Oscillospiraceae bacterium]